MTGPEHYRAAEVLLTQANHFTYGDGADPVTGAALAAEAQVHATLALASATAERNGYIVTEDDVMRCPHGAVICGLCGFGVNAGDGGRS